MVDEKVLEDLRAKARQISDEAWAAKPKRETPFTEATEIYYDADEDAALRREFYGDGFELPGDAREAYDVLHGLVDDHQQIGYSAARKELYGSIDRHPNGNLRSIYSGDEVHAAELIAADVAIETMLMAAAESYGVSLEAVETGAVYDCEHVVPQSWFAKDPPMKTDLHHLFTCAKACNEYRAHYSYFDFIEGPELDRCGRRDKAQNKFEPVEGKGPVARATLYFIVRYPRLVNRNGEYDEQRLEIASAGHARSRSPTTRSAATGKSTACRRTAVRSWMIRCGSSALTSAPDSVDDPHNLPVRKAPQERRSRRRRSTGRSNLATISDMTRHSLRARAALGVRAQGCS